MTRSGTLSQIKVIIVGAGPSGLLLGLRLAKENIDVTILEMGKNLDVQLRATHYGPPAVKELRKAGVIDDVRNRGFSPGGICWRKFDRTWLAGIDLGDGSDPDRIACLPLNQLGEILIRHISNQSSAKILWSHEVIAIEQDKESARVTAITPNGEETFEADYVVGCDGANSTVRKALFGDFPGKTWEEQIVATNVFYPFEKWGFIDSNFIIDKEHWYMAAKITTDGMWRVTYGEIYGLTREQLIERQPMKFETMLPGNPKPNDYKLINISPYKVHQRCARNFRVGRFLLVADAAHLCNPFGGLGLTGGLVDSGNLADCLIGINEGIADHSILDKYDEIRRAVWHDIINPVSSENIIRMHPGEPDKIMETDEFLRTLSKAEKEPRLMKLIILAMNAIQHDFTVYYTAPRTQQIRP